MRFDIARLLLHEINTFRNHNHNKVAMLYAIIPVRQAEAIAHARAIGEILRKDVTNCEEMMSLYFPI